ncbi:alpha-2-macroglobulin family protein [Mucilaginibacter yixingensis]|nr:alpha-2-macroglobulin family protein [Mucilaginibacter yixingensis]
MKSFNQHRRLKNSLFILLFLLPGLGHAQTARQIEKRIDSLVNLGLPKSALEQVNLLDQLGHKTGNTPVKIKAAIYRMTLQSYLDENSIVGIIDTLKANIRTSVYPAKPVLQSILGAMYFVYYRENRWKFAGRSQLEKPSNDFREWDLKTIINQTDQTFRSSLQDAALEQRTPVGILDGVLDGDENTRPLRPSLYDLLAQRALDFYLDPEPALPKPKLPFSLDDPRFFADSKTFAGLGLKTSDTLSTFYTGVKLLQQLTLFHLNRHNDAALIDVDIKRLAFMQQQSHLLNKDSLYATALRGLVAQADRQHTTGAYNADPLLELAKYYHQKNNNVQARNYCNQVLSQAPNSHAGRNAQSLISDIGQKTLTANFENTSLPNQLILALINYRNVKTINYRIYRLNAAQRDAYTQIEHGSPVVVKKWIDNNLQATQPTLNGSAFLPDLHDYQPHHTEIKIDGMPAGNYLCIMADSAAAGDSTLITHAPLKVSRLSYVTRSVANGQEVIVTDRETGAPLKNVLTQLNVKSSNWHSNGYIYLDTIAAAHTDAQGRHLFPWQISGTAIVTLAMKGDTLIGENYYATSLNAPDDEDDDPEERTVLFTDRQIYRPGQTVYFKGMQLKVFKHHNEIVPNYAEDVELKDANRKVLSKLELHTNEFGTFSGNFTLPQALLNGQTSIETGNGSIQFRVEEYKRPTFKAEFLPVTESYKLKDSIKVKGRVEAFSGYGLSQARVACHITRTLTIPGLYYYPQGYTQQEIKTDTLVTDNQGAFEIRFKEDDANLTETKAIYNYNLSVDVTDAAGETHSASTQVKVGNNNISLHAGLSAQILATDTARIPASISNLNGQPQKGTLRVQVYALQNPERLFKTRNWAVPDALALTRDEYHRYFPGYTYKNEADPASWAQREQISDTTLQVAGINNYFRLNALKKQLSGTYLILLSGRNEKGDTVSNRSYVQLISADARPQQLSNWQLPFTERVARGGNARAVIGLNEPVDVLLEKISNSKLVSSQWIHAARAKEVSVPILQADTNVQVQLTMVLHNRLYTSTQWINIPAPDTRLNLKLISYRDKLQPGDKEQWRLRVTGPDSSRQSAEVMAGMYDASLDDIASPTPWSQWMPTHSQRYYSWMWNSNFAQNQVTQPFKYLYRGYTLSAYDYERLDMFAYNYWGGYNYGYYNYLRTIRSNARVLQRDAEAEQAYRNAMKKVKDGLDVTGTVTDKNIGGLPGVSVKIKGTDIGVTTNSNGNFKMRVPVNGVLQFSFIGYEQKEVTVTKAGPVKIELKASANSLNEVSVVGYGVLKKASITGAVASVKAEELGSLNEVAIHQALEGKLAGVAGASGDYNIMIRGGGSISSDKVPLYVVDGVPTEHALDTLLPADIVSIDILKDAGATAIYGAKGANGVVIISTKSGRSRLMGGQEIAVRKNFNETVFFYPQLQTDEHGNVLINFTMPDALTSWKFRSFAHTKDLKTGYFETEVVTQKQLSITANTPRFLREGDTITIAARLANLNTAVMKGKVTLQLFNGVNMQPVKLLLNPAEAQQDFNIAPSTNKAISFKMAIPAGLEALTYRLVADGGEYSDGEENTLPVLPNRMLVTESMPMMVRAGQTRSFTMNKLVNNTSTTLQNKTLTLEYTQNPVWYAVQALPYMMEFQYECSEQLFSRFYANSMAAGLVNKQPAIKRVFDLWKATNSDELKSNLEKNQELKSVLLEETPWLRDAISETEQKRRIALLFDLNKMSSELKINLDKLKDRQLRDGGFPWFGGTQSDEYITNYIVAGIGQLRRLGMVDHSNDELNDISGKARDFLSDNLINTARRQKEKSNYYDRLLSASEIYAWYALSYFADEKLNPEMQDLLASYLKLANVQWLGNGVYTQALMALAMHRFGHDADAQKIIRSLKETAQRSDDMGMYWGKNQLGYYWYQSPIETQSLLIELFSEMPGNDKEVGEMKIWLLRNKQTANWKTTKATAQACYALLLRGEDWLTTEASSTVKLGNQPLAELKPDLKADAGTGYIKTTWKDGDVKPALGNVSVSNTGKTISWGALHWQYLENLDKITPSSTDIHLERKYFVVKQTDRGEILTAVDAAHPPKTGDLLKVVVYLKAGRDFEYVQLKDMRPAGTEPVDALSGYKFQDGLWYYQVTKDVATNFFISRLNKGNYVFEYRLRVAQPGNFSTGISTVQCMYAPEFNAHSEGTRMTIR